MATVVGVIRRSQLVILTERTLYVTRTGRILASCPRALVARHPIESVELSLHLDMPFNWLTMEDQAITFMGQRRRAREMIEAVEARRPRRTGGETCMLG